MSRKRQPDLGVRTFGVTTRIASLLPPQDPEWAQLVYALQGSLTVECPIGERQWYVPARRALLVPAGMMSKLRMRGAVRLRMLYVHRSLCPKANEPQAINIAPLFHEAILEAVRRSVVAMEEPLTGMIAELLVASPGVPLMLPMPRDARALRVAKGLIRDAGQRATLEELAHGAGAGIRTLERVFTRETGMGFAAWRQRLRMLESVRRLMGGDSVAEAADAVGYDSVSAFVVAFKVTLGETPGRWVRVLRGR